MPTTPTRRRRYGPPCDAPLVGDEVEDVSADDVVDDRSQRVRPGPASHERQVRIDERIAQRVAGRPTRSRGSDQARELVHPRMLPAPPERHGDTRWIIRVLGGRGQVGNGGVVARHPCRGRQICCDENSVVAACRRTAGTDCAGIGRPRRHLRRRPFPVGWLVRHGTVDGAAIGSIGGAVFSPVLVRLDPKERARRSRERGLTETLPVLERSE